MAISKKRLEEIESIRDKDIDYSDIPETDAAFWAKAEMVQPDRTRPVTLRIKKSVLKYFQADGKRGYQSRINAVLESYVRARKRSNDPPEP